MSVFDPQSVGTVLRLQLHLFFFFRSSFLLLALKSCFYFKTRLEEGCDLSLWTGREMGLCGGGLPGCKLQMPQSNELCD